MSILTDTNRTGQLFIGNITAIAINHTQLIQQAAQRTQVIG